MLNFDFMVISYNSQLGLRINSPENQIKFLELMVKVNKDLAKAHDNLIKVLENTHSDDTENITLTFDENSLEYKLFTKTKDNIESHGRDREIRDKINLCIGEKNLIDGDGSSYYFICESVHKCADVIKIKENFSGRTLKDINFGKYTYLMGKHRMVRFLVAVNAIKGFYYDDEKNIAFEWGIEMDDGGWYFDGNYSFEFSMVMRILTFVELGDISIKLLDAGKNNGELKKSGNKITNTSNKTVYVVDSNWNTLIMRTDGFAVRGHFRLQPCGASNMDRKLIWIYAFEKHGYKRKPTAEIIR